MARWESPNRMSDIFLPKVWNGRLARFLRFEGALTFIVLVDGEEQKIPRTIWIALPDQAHPMRSSDHRHHGQATDKGAPES